MWTSVHPLIYHWRVDEWWLPYNYVAVQLWSSWWQQQKPREVWPSSPSWMTNWSVTWSRCTACWSEKRSQLVSGKTEVVQWQTLCTLCKSHLQSNTKHLLILQFASLQRNCTNMWKTTVMSSAHIVVHMWICLSSSEKPSDPPRVCCEDAFASASEFTFKSSRNIFNSSDEGKAASSSERNNRYSLQHLNQCELGFRSGGWIKCRAGFICLCLKNKKSAV